jgi:drug/metabolite transporter (DMT)-like permease
VSVVAVGLILAAAACHATWNLVIKRAAAGPLFLFVAGGISAVLWAPLGIAFAVLGDASLRATVFAVAVSGCFHLTYFLSLQRGYRHGDLSLVYPLARGTGPAIAVVAAILIRHERPPVLGLVGAAAVVLGLLSLARGHASGSSAIAFALVTGVVIACYTLWDKHAVDDLVVAGVTMSWGTELVRAVALAPYALRRRHELRLVPARDALAFAVLSPLAYVLVLVALKTSAVASIAPAREISIVVGVLLGRLVLHEAVDRRRLLSAGVVATGVVLLAVA